MADEKITLKYLEPWQKKRLALGALKLTRWLLAQPGGRGMIDEEIARMRQEAQQKNT